MKDRNHTMHIGFGSRVNSMWKCRNFLIIKSQHGWNVKVSLHYQRIHSSTFYLLYVIYLLYLVIYFLCEKRV